MKSIYPEEDVFTPGHLACQGCGAAVGMRLLLKALGRKAVIIIPASCSSIMAGPFPYNTLGVPMLHIAFEATAAAASGLRAAFEVQGRDDMEVVGWAGDGATYDIGLQALSGAADRNDDILFVCYDNEAYMNTGIQRSSATPPGAWTATTPEGRLNQRPKKNMEMIMAAHRIPYIATASVSHPHDLINKAKRAREIRGTRFLHILTPCPTGWRYDPRYTVRIARMAVESKVFPLLEIFDGVEYHITVTPKGIPVRDYLEEQGRFQYLGEEDMASIQRLVDAEWESLIQRAIIDAPQVRIPTKPPYVEI